MVNKNEKINKCQICTEGGVNPICNEQAILNISKQENAMRKWAFLIGWSTAVEGAMPGSERPVRAVTVIQARGEHGVDKKKQKTKNKPVGMQSWREIQSFKRGTVCLTLPLLVLVGWKRKIDYHTGYQGWGPQWKVEPVPEVENTEGEVIWGVGEEGSFF